MTVLENIYNSFILDNEQFGPKFQTPQVKTSLEELQKMLNLFKSDFEFMDMLAKRIMEVGDAYQQQGFILGFKYAMELSNELSGKAGVFHV